MIKTDGKRTLILLGADRINLSCIQFNGISYVSGLQFEDVSNGNIVDIHLHTPEVIDAIIGRLNEVKKSIATAREKHVEQKSVEQKSVEQKSVEQKSVEQKPTKKKVRKTKEK